MPRKGWEEFSATKATDILSKSLTGKTVVVESGCGAEVRRNGNAWMLDLYLLPNPVAAAGLQQTFIYLSEAGSNTFAIPLDEATAEKLRAVRLHDQVRLVGVVRSVNVGSDGTFSIELQDVSLVAWQKTDDTEAHRPDGPLVELKPLPAAH